MDILKLYFSIYPHLVRKHKIMTLYFSNQLLLKNIFFIESVLLENEDKETLKIINDALIFKNKGLEYIAYSLYYSESGLRNRINLISLHLINKAENR